MRKTVFIIIILAVTARLPINAAAETYSLAGRPLNILGYITQSAAFGLGGDSDFDTEKGLQSALLSAFIEVDYEPGPKLKIYAAGLYSIDWIYDLKHNDRSWEKKQFSKSRDNLYKDDHYWQVLKELHVTWTPGNFFFRIGKQIVSWGETDGFRLMDQINPLDQRRGFADVEFETTIIPILLLRIEYYPEIDTGWITDAGFECIINPNADFIPSQPILPGNDAGGIWAPNVMTPTPLPHPFDRLRLGLLRESIDKPGPWDQDGFEVGIRLKAVVMDSVITLNYFNGLDNDYVSRPLPGLPGIERAYNDRLLIHPKLKGYYPDLRFAGVTFSRDLQSLRSSFFGGVAPVVRMEGFYAFDSTFATSRGIYKKLDEIRWAVGIDWKVKIRPLNPRAYFTLSPQFYHRKINNYPSAYDLQTVEDDNYMFSLMIRTSYINGKLVPSLFWLYDRTNDADLLRVQVDYQYSHEWHLRLGTLFLSGSERGRGFQVFENKDQVYFTISFRFG